MALCTNYNTPMPRAPHTKKFRRYIFYTLTVVSLLLIVISKNRSAKEFTRMHLSELYRSNSRACLLFDIQLGRVTYMKCSTVARVWMVM